MPIFNRVILCGHVCREPEKRVTQGGTATCDNSIAINDRHKATDGTTIEDVTFVDLSFWGKTAETFCKYVHKGDAVLVEGRLKQDRWEYEGKSYSKLKVVVASFQFIGSKNVNTQMPAIEGTQETSNTSGEYQHSPGRSESYNFQTEKNTEQYVDDIPF